MTAGAGLSVLLAVAGLWRVAGRIAPRVLLQLVPVFLLCTTAALAAHESTVRGRRMRRRQLRSRLAGEEAERRRWARELHDDTLQELAAVRVLLSAARTGTDAGARARAIEQAQDCVGHQIASLRRLIGHLRPLALDACGLVPALEDLARRNSRPDVAIEAICEPLPRLSGEAETAAYRIVQEAVTNAVRHANASRIVIEARTTPDGILVTVRDDGRNGADIGEFPAGFGLLGMRERAEAIGARLSLASDHGLAVSLEIPYSGTSCWGG